MNQISITLPNFNVCGKYEKQTIAISVFEDKDQYYWGAIITNQNMHEQLKKYVKNTQRLFQYLQKKPSQRIGFEQVWITENDIGETVLNKNVSKLIIKIQICDQIEQIFVRLSKKQYSPYQQMEKRCSKIQAQKNVLGQKVVQLEQKTSIMIQKIKHLEQQLANKNSQFNLQRKKYQRQINDIKSQIYLSKYNNQSNENQSYFSLSPSKQQIKKRKEKQKNNIDYVKCVKRRPDRKMCLKLQRKQLQAHHIEQIMKFKWDSIDVLDIGNNYFGDDGLKLLAQGNWPKLKQLYLQDSQLTQINYLQKLNIQQLQVLNIHLNYLTQSSAKFILNQKWSNLHTFTVSFIEGVAQQCWNILFSNMLKEFPSLKALSIFQFQNIDKKLRQKICQWNQGNIVKIRWYNKQIKEVKGSKQISTM